MPSQYKDLKPGDRVRVSSNRAKILDPDLYGVEGIFVGISPGHGYAIIKAGISGEVFCNLASLVKL